MVFFNSSGHRGGRDHVLEQWLKKGAEFFLLENVRLALTISFSKCAVYRKGVTTNYISIKKTKQNKNQNVLLEAGVGISVSCVFSNRHFTHHEETKVAF